MEKYFDVTYRNPGDWDIYNRNRRIYRIRRIDGKSVLWGDHEFSNKPERTFTNVQSCMAEVCAELMNERS